MVTLLFTVLLMGMMSSLVLAQDGGGLTDKQRTELKELVTLRVYDMQGQLVAELVDAPQSEGKYSIDWSGRNTNGSVVASGTYVYRITAGDQVISRQMLLTK